MLLELAYLGVNDGVEFQVLPIGSELPLLVGRPERLHLGHDSIRGERANLGVVCRVFVLVGLWQNGSF